MLVSAESGDSVDAQALVAHIHALGRRLSADPAKGNVLGRLLASQWQGAVHWWPFTHEGTLRGYLRRELGDWLAAAGLR